MVMPSAQLGRNAGAQYNLHKRPNAKMAVFLIAAVF